MDTKIIKSWLRYIAPILSPLHQIKKVVVLGYGSGHHIFELQRQYPHIEIIVVDPRKENVKLNFSLAPRSFQYVSAECGVLRLQALLKRSRYLIPVIEFRPCWEPYSDFFSWSEVTLKGTPELKEWMHTPTDFILQSLFV